MKLHVEREGNRAGDDSGVPVRVQLQQNAQTDRQLSGEEDERLATRDIATRERSRAGPL